MAVPKKKRYKQVVKTRRSLQKINLILKKNLFINKFSNFVSINEEYSNITSCFFCKNHKLGKHYCLQCLDYFIHVLKKVETKEKRYRLRDITQEHYTNLAKRLRLAHLNWINQ